MQANHLISSVFPTEQETSKGKLPSDSDSIGRTEISEPKIVLEGWMDKREESSTNWEKGLFVLRDDGTFLRLETEPVGGKYPASSKGFNVEGCLVSKREKPRRYSFVIHGSRHDETMERMFSVSSDRVRSKWVHEIEAVDRKLRDQEDRAAQASTPEQISSSDSTREVTSKRVSLEDFEIVKKIGGGSFGVVMLSRERLSGRLHAMKTIKKTTVTTKGELAQTLAESRVLRKTCHPFIVKLNYCFQTTDSLYLVMEFVQGGELFFHLLTEDKFSEEKARFYGAEIVLALEYLHRQGIIYRDLKTDNVLLDHQGHVKITDFGLCKDGMFYGVTTQTMCGTPEYMAPEVISGPSYDRVVDWWGLGAVMYEMMCGEIPFYCRQNETELVYDMILKKQVSFPTSLSEEAKSLLEGLLTKDPKLRLGGGALDAEDVKAHEFFRGVSWTRILSRKITPPFVPRVASEDDTRNFDLEAFQSARLTSGSSGQEQGGCWDFSGFSFYGDTAEQRQTCTHSSASDPKKARL